MALDFDTTNLLRPNQVEDANDEMARLGDMINGPPHITGRISDMGELRRRFRTLKVELEKVTPRPFAPNERDAATSEFARLADEIRLGMPSNEEMRRNPPGAVGKNREWQQRTKKAVARYKHLALRLLAGGDLPAHIKRSGDVANIELLRPLTTSNQLAMDGAQIPKTRDFHIGDDVANAVTFSAEEIALISEASPELAGQLAILPNDARAGIKAVLAKAMAPATVPEKLKGKPGFVGSEYNRMKQAAAAAGVPSYKLKKPQLKAILAERGVEY